MVIPFLPALWTGHLWKYKAKVFRAPALLKLFELALHPFSLCVFAFRWGEVNSILFFLRSSDGKWHVRFSDAECCRSTISNYSAKTFNMGAWGKKNTISSMCVRVCVSGSDTFVEVGMPRSPSHSGNSNELKQMLASCKTSSGKRQALELLQGTKNSLLQYEHTSEQTQSLNSQSLVDVRGSW